MGKRKRRVRRKVSLEHRVLEEDLRYVRFVALLAEAEFLRCARGIELSKKADLCYIR